MSVEFPTRSNSSLAADLSPYFRSLSVCACAYIPRMPKAYEQQNIGGLDEFQR